MSTYISNNKFQFITDFGKHAYLDVKGNAYELNFNDLSIAERLMLSSYLTFLCCNKENKLRKNDLYNLIFDFNGKNKKKTSYQDAFIEDLSNFITRQPYYFAYVKSHYDEIVNDKTFIYRQQLNHSEMELLYSLKFQRNYHSLMNVLYIIGVAKQNITSAYLNKIPLSNIYSHSTLAKKRVEEIFSKINSVSAKEVKFKISKDILYFGNGFFIEEDEKYQSTEKQQFNKLQAEEEIISSLVTSPDEVCNEIVDEIQKHTEEKEKNAKVKLPKAKTPVEPIVEETEETIPDEEPALEVNVNELIDDIPFSNIDPDTILDLGEDKRFNFDIFKKLYEYEQDNYQYCTKEYDKIKAQLNSKAPEVLRKMLKQYNLDINNYLSKYENLSKVYRGEKLGDNWQEIKDNARLEFDTVKTNISRGLDNLFDKNFTAYKFIVYYIATKNKQFVTLSI